MKRKIAVVGLLSLTITIYLAYLKVNSVERSARALFSADKPIPRSVDEAHERLIQDLSFFELRRIRSMISADETIIYHRTLGISMRNNWQLWKGGELSEELYSLGFRHPDGMSVAIFESFWRRLHNQPLALREAAAAENALYAEREAYLLDQARSQTQFSANGEQGVAPNP